MKLNWREFARIGTSRTVLDWIRNGVQLPWISFPSGIDNLNRVFRPDHKQFVSQEINKLVHIGALQEVSWRPECVLALQINPKKGGKLQLVTDCRPANNFLRTPEFKQEGILQLENIVQEGDYFITLDLKDGFFHVPVAEDSTRYLGILWKQRFYIWRVLPFGLSASPYFFYKTLHPVLNWARTHGI